MAMLAVTVMAAMIAAPDAFADDNAPTFDFHGYMRSGIGHFNHGGREVAYNKDKVGRLGNESDTYGELELGTRAFKKGDAEFYIDSMIAVSSNGSADWEGTSDQLNTSFDDKKGVFSIDEKGNRSDNNASFALRQFNVQAKGLIPGQKDATIWAGKRYYQRKDVHLWDYYYLDISGAGAGLENLQLGPGKLSIAWTRRGDSKGDFYEKTGSFKAPSYRTIKIDAEGNVSSETNYYTLFNTNFFDARYAGSYWNGGWLEFAATVASPERNDIGNGTYKFDNGTSVMLTAEATFSGSWGFNKTTLQWANKGLSNEGSQYYVADEDRDGAYRISLINQGEAAIGTDSFHLMHAARYVYIDYGDGDTQTKDNEKLLVVGLRPSFQVSTYSRIVGEIGAFWDKTSYKGADDSTSQGQKYTLAYAIAPSASLWARPEIRFYCSYLHASNNGKIGGSSLQNYNANGEDEEKYKSGVNIGVQAEAWW